MASGCDDSAFLKESPESSYAIENVFKSSNQVKQVVTSCYEKVRDIFCTSAPMQFSPRHFYMGNNGTDMFDVPNGRDAQNMNDYSKLQPTMTFTSKYTIIFIIWYPKLICHICCRRGRVELRG